MYRIILFLVLIALAASGAAWVADQSGDVTLSWGGLRIAILAAGIGAVAWHDHRRGDAGLDPIARALAHCRNESGAAGASVVSRGAAMPSPKGCSRSAMAIPLPPARMPMSRAAMPRDDPLALLLHAQSAQLDGDRDGARRAFHAMAEREDTRLLGLRGLFIEAQRADDPVAAVMIAEEALKLAPASTWASQAVLGFRCARGDWSGALTILDNNLDSGLIDKPALRRQRGVLLTARALELENIDRDRSRDTVMEAIKLAPTLVPAAVLASKYQSEAHQVRRSMRIVEAAWLAQPHPDLADAYAHVRLGDSARQRLVRVETLAAKVPGHLGERAGGRPRRDRCHRVCPRARSAGAVRRRTDPACRDADGGNRAHRTRRQRPGAGMDLARGARAARSGLDRGRICFRVLAAGVAGVGPHRRLSMADAAGGIAFRQKPGARSLALRGSDAGRAPRRVEPEN